MGERNCWMCRWATKGGGCFPESDMAPGTNDWIEDHCTEHDLMPPKDSPPCPTWASINPADVEAATLRAAWAAVGVVWGEDGRVAPVDGMTPDPMHPGAMLDSRGRVVIDATLIRRIEADGILTVRAVLACIADAQVAALGVGDD